MKTQNHHCWKIFKFLKIFHPFLVKTLVLSFVFISGCGLLPDKPSDARAVRGLIDLSETEFGKNNIIKLDGEWEFYWEQLLSPESFINEQKQSPPRTGYYTMPGKWNRLEVKGQKLSGDGYATFTLTITGLVPGTKYGLKVQEAASAYRLWAGKELVSSNGKVGKTPDTMKPEFMPVIAFFTPMSGTTKLVLQVSNFYDFDGGIWHSIRLGTEKHILDKKYIDISLDVFLFGVLFIMGLYHIGLYILRKKELSALFFSLVCLVMSLRTLLLGERLLKYIFPGLSWELLVKVEHITMYAVLPLVLMFIHTLFDKVIHKPILRFTQAAGIITSLLVFILPVKISTYMMLPYQILLIIISFYLLIVLIAASIKRMPGAIYISLGFLLLYLSAINDVLYDCGIINTCYMASIGGFLITLAQSFVISMKFSTAYKKAESLSNELQELNGLKDTLLRQYENARQKNLQNRMDPHFLFNAINTIHAIIQKDRESAGKAIIILSDIYRFLLERSYESLISFNDEWEFTRSYLEFMKVDFPDTLSFNMKISGDFRNIMIPPLTIQPLVENAIKHGLDGIENGIVDVSSSINNNRIEIIVSDNGRGIKDKKVQLPTLENIRERLEYYFIRTDINISKNNPRGTIVAVSFSMPGDNT